MMILLIGITSLKNNNIETTSENKIIGGSIKIKYMNITHKMDTISHQDFIHPYNGESSTYFNHRLILENDFGKIILYENDIIELFKMIKSNASLSRIILNQLKLNLYE